MPRIVLDPKQAGTSGVQHIEASMKRCSISPVLNAYLYTGFKNFLPDKYLQFKYFMLPAKRKIMCNLAQNKTAICL